MEPGPATEGTAGADDVDDDRARRRAAIAEAFDAVVTGPRIRISDEISVPLRLLGTIQDSRK